MTSLDAPAVPRDAHLRVTLTDFGGQVRCPLIVALLVELGILICHSWYVLLVDGSWQETYQQTHPVLFSDRAVYLIVYNLRTGISQSDLVRLVMNVAVRAPEAPVLLVGTHCDLVRESGRSAAGPLLRALQQRFPQVSPTHPGGWGG